ncbi:hypothetical protein ILYODFUR_013224 [Ilyodon furcidens]|uniref:Secreted protein n=1 Tax=Ilyodon furcidens TaxID=33524 RepID=A0ABV0SXM0_9TELE
MLQNLKLIFISLVLPPLEATTALNAFVITGNESFTSLWRNVVSFVVAKMLWFSQICYDSGPSAFSALTHAISSSASPVCCCAAAQSPSCHTPVELQLYTTI